MATSLVSGWSVTTETPPMMDATDGLDTEKNTTCSSYVMQSSHFINYYTLLSFIYITVVGFFTQRKRFKPDICRGRPGVVYPVDLLTESSHRHAVAASFLMCGGRIYMVANGQHFWLPNDFVLPEALNTYPFIKVILIYFYIVQLAVCFYSILLSIRLRRYIIANVMGVIAVIPWLVSSFRYYVRFSDCLKIRGLNDALNALANDIPVWMAATVLIVTFIYDLVQNIKKRFDKHPIEENPYNSSHYGDYVKSLLAREWETHDVIHAKTKMLAKYHVVPDFRYPTRIITTFVCALFFIFRISVSISMNVKTYHDEYRAGEYDAFINVVFTRLNATESIPQARTSIVVFLYLWWFSIVHAFFWLTAMLFHTGKRYRKHTLLLFRGDRGWMSKLYKDLSPIEIMPSQLCFTGYQIAYAGFGLSVLMTMTLLVLSVFALGLIVPLVYGANSPIVDNLYSIWPTLFLSTAITMSQAAVAKRFFLQDQGQTLAVDNKRVYHVVEYFLFFLNVIWGSYRASRRIMSSFFIGAARIARLDHCFMLSGYKGTDEGYKTYHCSLLMDLHTYHPIMRSFVEILQYEADKRMVNSDSSLPLKRRRIRLRWFKYAMLLRNPSLIPGYQLIKNREEDDKWSSEGDVRVNNVARRPSVTEIV